MLKKSVKLIIALALSLTILTPLQASNASAKCVPSNIGQVCDDKNIHSVQNVKVYYTKSDVKNVVNRYNSLGSNTGLILGYIAGLHPVAGISVLMTTVGANNIIEPFKTAQNKGTGLEISYTVTIYTNTTVPKISNTKYTYK